MRQCGLRSRPDHLWLTLGLVVLAATSLGVAGLIVAGAWSGAEARYAMGGNLAGTVLLAVAAFAPAGRLKVRARSILAPGTLIAALVFAATALFAGAAPGAGRVPVQVAIAITLVVAAIGLARRASARDEALLRWIAIAVVLGGFAKLDYALFPPTGADNVHLGDALRMLAWATLFAGVLGELRRNVRARADAAVDRERRRLARELHDGVAQELAFIRRRAGRLGETADGIEILGAAERALEDSRRAIEALVPPASETLDVALERLGAKLASECDLEVQVNVRAHGEVSDEVRAELSRIICEATRNAAHHGGARHVRVDVAGTPLAVRIIDDGSGFRDGASSGLGIAGYGLIAMRERAELVGGKFSLESVRGAGTLVQVVLP
ncbi:sensor histidine kinase [Solirubrobacter deserti]|uniref:histidine kinase n=1 Tax=Solirubrobacter deserti TaxID=2282478 RepID=A0ABT4RDM2_9ACTN|nr:ATP-binding protein [Solirubrobacter deserti]MDA0136635.1 histidine kinase [Solirubrobacter deserti]